MNVENAVFITREIMQTNDVVNPKLVCDELGIKIISDKKLNNDGYLICANGKRLILINKLIKNEHRKMFIISHEIGHFLMHPAELQCCELITDSSCASINTSLQERQANEYASEILLPSTLVKEHLMKKTITVAEIDEISRKYNVSFTHAAIKAIKNSSSENEILLSYSNGVLKWYQSSNKDIFFEQIPNHCPVNLLDKRRQKVVGYWDDLFYGKVIQEIIKVSSTDYLVLLQGSCWRR